MKTTLFFLVAVILALASCQPSPPSISEVFSANINFFEIRDHYNVTGNGVWAANQPQGKNVERYIVGDKHPLNRESLQRYDLKRGFNQLFRVCEEYPLDGNMPALWNWLSQSKYSQLTYEGKTYDAWSLTLGYATVTLATSNNVPQWFFRYAPEANITVQFVDWNTAAPNASLFDVPTDCHTTKFVPSGVGCEARSTIISRAEVWVEKHIPYSQTTTYMGYREDCSGYVSMAWETSKPGYTTYTLPEISHRITKAELSPGDVLLCTSEHVVLFGGWANADKTQYIAYEETRPGEGTVRRATPYPYWYNTGCFLPYRYKNVC